MSKMLKFLLSFCLLFSAVCSLAQEEMHGPPKVLQVIREFLKPGKAGAAHQRTESGFVNAFRAAKWPTHYLAADSLSGAPRSVFFVGFDSFAAWEKDNAATAGNASLSAAVARASAADGELLSSYESSTYVFRDDQSFNVSADIPHMRYFEVSLFRVKPGHMQEWDALVKMYKDNYGKAVPDAHWATYEDMYGSNNGGVYMVITPMKSLSEVDEGFGNSKKFAAAIGESGMKKLSELTAASVESTQTNLLQFNPAISYPSDEWIKADSFWKPAQAAGKKAADTKPAQ